MDNAEKERIRIRTEERTRITAKIVSQIGDLLLEDLENSKQSGGSKSNTFAKKKETKKPQNFHHKNNHQKGGNNGPRPNQNSNQHINVYCSSNQNQNFNNTKQSNANNQTGNRSHSNTANYSRKPVAQVNKGPMPSQTANQHINIHCTSRQQQSFHNANSSGSKPSGMVKFNPQGKKPGAIMNQNSKFQHH
ncbi:hypothetical protein Avbf_04031 [Armadillidium vulgare]|nr:hypothetical protein Avbf_04031 [Armadillidium vulgare]